MSPAPLTAPARLQILLPWLNGALDRDVVGPNPLFGQRAGEGPEDVFTWTDYPAIRRALDDFMATFDGSEGAAHLVAEPYDEALDDEAIDGLEAMLRILLEQGFGEPSLQGDMCSLPLAGLRLALRPSARAKPQWKTSKDGRQVVDGGVRALRAWNAPGVYVLRVLGPRAELVPFLLVHLLAQAGMVALKRCERRGQPRFHDCLNLFIIDPGRRGRPQRFCAPSCGKKYNEQQEGKKR